MLLLSVLALAVDLTYAHQPLAAYNAAIGSTQKRVGLYSVTACNYAQHATIVDEGMLVSRAPLQSIQPALYLSVLEASQRPTKLHRVLQLLYLVAEGASVYPGPTQAKRLRYYAAGATGLFHRLAGATAPRATRAEVVQSLVVPGRSFSLNPGACESRLILGRYDADFKAISRSLQ
jgi:hypothetical protein